MSADVDTVRAAYAAFNRGDDSFFEYLDPEIEWIPAAQFVEGPVQGHDEVRRLVDTFTEAFETIQWNPVRIEDVPEQGLVVALIESNARGKGSGAEVRVRVAHLLRVRAGKIVWGKIYPDADEGFAAAGLERPAD